MFGRQGISIPLDRPDEAVSTFFGPGATGPAKNTSYSALAAIKRFNPTQWWLEMAWAAEAPISEAQSEREVWERIPRRRELRRS